MDISTLKKDSSAIAAGQWVGDIPGLGEVRLYVRGLSSAAAVSLRQRKERAVPNDQRERDGSLKPDAAVRLTTEVLHEAILLGWEGLTSGGKPLAYDSETARKYLTDPDFEAFADAVVWASRVVDRGTAATKEALEKNSATPSSGV